MPRRHSPTLQLWALLCAAGLGCLATFAGCARETKPPSGVAAAADRHLAPDTEEIKGRVPRAGTLATIFRKYLPADRAELAVQLIARSMDPRKLRAEQPFTLTRTTDGWLRHFQYEIDPDRYLRVAPTSPETPRILAAEVIPYRREVQTVTVAGTIDKQAPSLFEATARTGETDDLAVELAAVFAGEIDFNSELQSGDTFRAAFEKIVRENGTVAYGAIHTAEFVNDGRRLKAIRFTLPDGTFGYYDENGRSLKRFFLKSPLKFEPRITSGFSYSRRHPVLNVQRAHLGVDYAAPIGAPVVAVSNGVVTQAGFAGDAGRLVVVRHSSGYESLYMHLSAILVRPGQRISQGETIARVGSSGLSTGPHLDYRLRKNGAYVNPILEHRRMPPGEPIPAALMTAFTGERDRVIALLARPSGTIVSATPATASMVATGSGEAR
jgi:murein DD-endopeptidase MepM/ murein hydrolase activator NlpD